MAPNPAILALLQAKLQQQAGAPAPGTPVAPEAAPAPAPALAPATAPFPSTDPDAVGQMLSPLGQAQQADQAQLANEQQQAAGVAMQGMLSRLASRPNPEGWAAQGGPGYPVSGIAPTQDASSGNRSY